MRPRGIADGAAVVPLFGMAGGRRANRGCAELEAAVQSLVVAVRLARTELERRPRQLADLDRAVSHLYALILVRQPGGAPSLLALLEQHERRIAELELKLERRDALAAGPARAAGGRR